VGDVALSNREKIMRLEAGILELPQVECETFHYFAPGIYCREIRIPAGMVLTGKIHRTEHINIISQGVIAVLTEEGRKLIEAPLTFVAPAGTKRAGFALKDTVWTTVHSTNETDLEKLERELIVPSFELLERQE
jgi:hypothetical protein